MYIYVPSIYIYIHDINLSWIVYFTYQLIVSIAQEWKEPIPLISPQISAGQKCFWPSLKSIIIFQLQWLSEGSVILSYIFFLKKYIPGRVGGKKLKIDSVYPQKPFLCIGIQLTFKQGEKKHWNEKKTLLVLFACMKVCWLADSFEAGGVFIFWGRGRRGCCSEQGCEKTMAIPIMQSIPKLFGNPQQRQILQLCLGVHLQLLTIRIFIKALERDFCCC